MRLKKGQVAPNFLVKDYYGNDVSIDALKGQKVLLSFYRYASCPLCNLRIHNIINKMDYFRERNLNVIAVFQSPLESMKQYVGNQEVPFPLISDPEWKLYKKYGVQTSFMGLIKAVFKRMGELKKAGKKGFKIGKSDGKMTTIPADFLINEQGQIEVDYYGADIGDHLPFERIMEWIK
ncbi:peroxiredoxin family protein [Mycoplasmatota bacterium WC44]